jgi:hypothetical protein
MRESAPQPSVSEHVISVLQHQYLDLRAKNLMNYCHLGRAYH